MTDAERIAIFRSLLSLCGLSQAEAADVLDRGHETVRQKAAGHKPVVDRDLQILRDLFLRIDAGDTDLTGRPAEQMEAIRWARSVFEIDTSGDGK